MASMKHILVCWMFANFFHIARTVLMVDISIGLKFLAWTAVRDIIFPFDFDGFNSQVSISSSDSHNMNQSFLRSRILGWKMIRIKSLDDLNASILTSFGKWRKEVFQNIIFVMQALRWGRFFFFRFCVLLRKSKL